MDSQGKIFERLQSQFCPPLDSSLVAALLSDVDTEVEASEEQINSIYKILTELAAQADELQLAEEFSGISVTDDNLSVPSFERETSTSASGSESSQHSFSSPLGFLRAALPHVQIQKLRRALLEAEVDGGEVDIWEVVASILSEESIREMEERGLDGLDDEDGLSVADSHKESSWEVVGKKPRSNGFDRRKKKRNHQTKITLGDIRQQQYAKPSSCADSSCTSTPAPDPWSQIASLSTHLASLLPTHSTSFFSSYFHSPQYASPYLALVAALQAIVNSHTATEDYTSLLISLLDILLPAYEDLDPVQHSRLISDTELSLNATQGRGDEALDLVHLLREFDDDSSSGYLGMGIYHQPMAAKPAASESHPVERERSIGVGASTRTLPSGPPPVPPPPSMNSTRSFTSRTGNKPSPYQWQSVPQRRLPRRTPNPHAAYIPAYTRDVNGIKVRGSGNSAGKGGKGDVGELGEFRKRIGESMRKRNEMLREASRMWQKGNSKTRGGEVALYFAERARQFQEIARKDALDAARMMVETNRISTPDRDTIDLHGTTASEAVIIAKETLQNMGCSSAKPLKVITGRGTHSANQVSVLKPALRKALVEDGWTVSSWDAGLIIRGKR